MGLNKTFLSDGYLFFFYRLRIKDPKSFIDVVKKILSKTFKVVVLQITLAHENLLLFTDKYQAFY